jgi:tetratricopeptide (TPR) repeat protein
MEDISYLEEIIKNNPKHLFSLLCLAHSYDYRKKISILNKIIEIDPENIYAISYRCYNKNMMACKNSDNEYNDIIIKFPFYVPILTYYAKFKIAKKAYNKAYAINEKIIKLDPENIAALWNLVEWQEHRIYSTNCDNYKKSKLCYEKLGELAVRRLITDSEQLYEIGSNLEKYFNNYKCRSTAEKCYMLALDDCEDTMKCKIYDGIGQLFMHGICKDLDKSIKYFNLALEGYRQERYSGIIHNNLGNIYVRLEQLSNIDRTDLIIKHYENAEKMKTIGLDGYSTLVYKYIFMDNVMAKYYVNKIAEVFDNHHMCSCDYNMYLKKLCDVHKNNTENILTITKIMAFNRSHIEIIKSIVSFEVFECVMRLDEYKNMYPKLEMKNIVSCLEDNCCVCLDKFEGGTNISILSCHHVVHTKCSHNLDKCPLCRVKIDKS